jgi:hypothetical protein
MPDRGCRYFGQTEARYQEWRQSDCRHRRRERPGGAPVPSTTQPPRTRTLTVVHHHPSSILPDRYGDRHRLSSSDKMVFVQLGRTSVPTPISLNPRPCHRLSVIPMSTSGFLSSTTTTGPPRAHRNANLHSPPDHADRVSFVAFKQITPCKYTGRRLYIPSKPWHSNPSKKPMIGELVDIAVRSVTSFTYHPAGM